jgi:hypothetical protein
MKQDIGWTFLVCFFAAIQVKIYLCIGVVTFIKKIYSSKALRNLSELIMNYFLPIYAIIEIARMTTKENITLIWILIIGILLSITVGYACGRLAHYMFKLDERISYSFSLLTSLPSIGTLPLVLGKSLCFPGAPLEDDPQCANILGFMLMNYLIFQLILNFVGFQVLTKDSNFSRIVDEKLSYLWRILIGRFVKKDYTVLYLFKKYMNDKKQAVKQFDDFIEKYQLIQEDSKFTLKGAEEESVNNTKVEACSNGGDINKEIIKNIDKEEKADTIIELDEENHNHKSNVKAGVSVNKEDSSYFNENSISITNAKQVNLTKISESFDVKGVDTTPIHKVKDMGENKLITNIILAKQQNSSMDDEQSDNNKINSIKDIRLDVHEKLINKDQPLGTHSNKQLSKQTSKLNKDEGFLNKQELNKENVILHGKSSKNLHERLPSEEVEFIEPIKNDLNNHHDKGMAFNKLVYSQKEVTKNFIKKESVNELNEIIQDKKNKLRRYETDNDILKLDGHFGSENEERTALMKFYEEPPVYHKLPLTSDRDVHCFQLNMNENFLIIHPNDFLIHKKIKEEQLEEKKRLVRLRQKSSKIIFEDVHRYYTKIFCTIEKDFNNKLEEDYEHEKMDILKDVYLLPPKFPIVKCVLVNKVDLMIVEEEWKRYEELVKKVIPNFRLTSPQIAFNIQIVLKFLYIPAIVGCIFGLLVGLSHMREILFSTNHYITNLVDGIYILTKATVPIMYIPIGVGFVATKGMHMQLPLSKIYIAISFIVRFLILPCVGYLYVYLWTTYYGGVIATSKVFRITMFIPFCVPSTANLVVMTNIVKFFVEETAFILLLNNSTNLVTLPLLYMIYFIIIGA